MASEGARDLPISPRKEDAMIFAHLSDPEPITGPAPARCTRKASAILRHSADQKPVAVCENRSGAMVYLCTDCVSYLKAERWLISQGIMSPSSIAIRTAARLLGAKDGYEPSKANDHRAEGEWFYLRAWERTSIARRLRREVLGPDDRIQAVRVLFVARDACLDPKCLRRDGSHSADCSLTYGPPFAERTEKRVV